MKKLRKQWMLCRIHRQLWLTKMVTADTSLPEVGQKPLLQTALVYPLLQYQLLERRLLEHWILVSLTV